MEIGACPDHRSGKDHLGSIRVVVDEDGNVSSWQDYYPFGKTSRSGGTDNTAEKFTGKKRDDESGLDYFGARYYNGDIGKWISTDPLSSKYPSLTPFNYAGNNPIFYVDPNGMEIGKGKDIFDSYRRKVEEKLKNAQEELAKQQSREKKNKKKITGLQNDISELSTTMSELDQLASSQQMYDIMVSPVTAASGYGGEIGYNQKTNAVNVFITSLNDYQSMAHEFKHAFQYDIGATSISGSGRGGGYLHDLVDEAEAYKRGALFGGPAYSVGNLQTHSKYKVMADRTTQRTLGSPHAY